MNIASLYAPVHVQESTAVGEHRIVGYPEEARVRAEQRRSGSTSVGEPVVVGANCLIGNHVVVHEGVRIGAGCVVEDRVRIGYNSTVGERTRIVYGALVVV